jgi:hypothetical protein
MKGEGRRGMEDIGVLFAKSTPNPAKTFKKNG